MESAVQPVTTTCPTRKGLLAGGSVGAGVTILAHCIAILVGRIDPNGSWAALQFFYLLFYFYIVLGPSILLFHFLHLGDLAQTPFIFYLIPLVINAGFLGCIGAISGWLVRGHQALARYLSK